MLILVPIYRPRTISNRSWFEDALDYKPRILDPNIEEFPCLVHKLFVALTALQYKPQWKMGLKDIQTLGYNGAYGIHIVL